MGQRKFCAYQTKHRFWGVGSVEEGASKPQVFLCRGGTVSGQDPSLGGDWVPLAPQVGDTELLPRGSWSPAGIRHHQVGAWWQQHGWGRAWAPFSRATFLVCLFHSRETYNSLAAWLTDARTLASPNIVVILCGNKKDLDPEREVTFLEASRFAQENGEGWVVLGARWGRRSGMVLTALNVGVQRPPSNLC